MKKRILQKSFIAFALLGMITTQMNSQTSWEFTDAASGTNVWVPTNLTTTQGKNLATYTTTGTADPEINTTALGLTTGTDASSDQSRRIIGITMRISSGGPDYIRVSHPDDTNNDGSRHITNWRVVADGKWRTYAIDMAANATYRSDWGSLIAEGGSGTAGTENDIKITFRTYNASDPNGDAYTTSGATVEIDRIEFVNNAWKTDVLNGTNGASNDNWGNNGNWFITPGPNTSANSALDILIPTPNGTPVENTNLNVNLTNTKYDEVHIGASAKLTMLNGGKNVWPVSLILSPGGSFAHDTGSNFSTLGTVTVKMDIPDTDWHLISSPVNVEQYDDTWISNNGIASGTGNNRGISTYNNGTPDGTTGHWRYFQASGTASDFTLGIGYSLKRTGKGLYSFVGDAFVSAATISPGISQGASTNWNLVGSPYTAHLNAATFISDNNSILPAAGKAIYVWNGTSYVSLTTGDLAVGQAFFINNDNGASNIAFNAASHSVDSDNSATFYRNNSTKVDLSIRSEGKTIKTFITYEANMSKGLNPGGDISLFDGVESDLKIYTHLLSDNTGIAFERQALPDSELESMVIPVGVKAAAGKEIAFTAEALNLPTGIKVFLEDRVANTFTRLDEANSEYKITLANAIDGVGRFYLYTTQSSLSVDDTIKLSGVSIFKTDVYKLRIAGLPNGKASISLFNILGKQVMTNNFDANGTKDISLPKLETGVYFAKVQTASGKISKKIILE